MNASNSAASAGRSLPSAATALPIVQRRTHGSQPLHWRQQPSVPPCSCVDSADCSRNPARHFGGNYANSAQIANLPHSNSYDFNFLVW
ncbi:MAG: hypothetical protein H0X30_37460 [Anaerolineae bacterium]|nr:hypothetical protein [Anaerolineae bacterium]